MKDPKTESYNNKLDFNLLEEKSTKWRRIELTGKKPKDLAELIYRIMVIKEKTVYHFIFNVYFSSQKIKPTK